MALIPKITVSLSCDGNSFTFTETTGAYHVSDNPGGYGSPNPTTGASTGSLVITHESTDVEYDPITITPSSTDGETVIDYDEILLDTEPLTAIADGVWKFVYTVTSASVDYTAEFKVLVIKSINCSIAELAHKYADESCGCCNNKDFRDYLLTAYAKLIALRMSPICGSVSKIQTQIDSLEDYLQEINCKNC